MKKVIVVTTFLMVLAVAPMAMADQVKLYRETGYYTGSGGEFTVQIIGSGSPDLNWVLPLYDSKTKDIGNHDPSFQTFCIEKNEFVSIGTTYDFSISNRAYSGGVGTAGDPISVGTAWLYHHFQNGDLKAASLYDYTGSGRSADAGKLQNTIWWLEGEGGDPGSGNEFRQAVLAKFHNSYAEASSDNGGLYGHYSVAVLNLWAPGHVNDFSKDGNGNYMYLQQDQLVCVPEPASMLLLGSGLIGLAGFARRRFKK